MSEEQEQLQEEGGEEDPRVMAAMQEYLAAIDAGKKVDRRAFVAKHPEIAGELSACLQGLAFLNAAAGEFAPPRSKEDEEVAAAAQTLDRAVAMAEPLGDFKLIKEIGRGGMGVVYEAVQLSLGRRVAVKVLPLAASLDRKQLQRFRNEAQAAASLHHTHIVPVYAVGSERSVHYYAMQLIEGRSLGEVIKTIRAREELNPPSSGSASPTAPTVGTSGGSGGEGRESILPDLKTYELSQLRVAKRASYFRTVVELIVQAAEALDYAHGLGIVHRDVKPANLLLDPGGSLWVTDFGLAQIYAAGGEGDEAAEGGVTQSGDLIGTYLYMSPEQAAGRSAVLDQRTDVYSLGVTLYELLTLKRAVTATTREGMIRQILDEDVPNPRMIDKRIPEELATIVRKATAKEPGERYQSAKGFAEDLQRFLKDEPIRARPPTFRDKAWKFVRRHKGFSLGAAAALMVGVIGLAATTALVAREQVNTKLALKGESEKAREAQLQKRKAEQNFEAARDAVKTMTQVAAQELPRDFSLIYVRRRLLEAAIQFQTDLLKAQPDADDGELAMTQAQMKGLFNELSAVDEMIRIDHRQMLLMEPGVQEDLDLSGEQRAKLREIRQDRGGPMAFGARLGMGGGGVASEGGGTERTPTTMPATAAGSTTGAMPWFDTAADLLRTLARERERAIDEVLTKAQGERVRQVGRQVRGVFSLLDPDVAAALGLTDYQAERIRVFCSQAAASTAGPRRRFEEGRGERDRRGNGMGMRGPRGAANEGPGEVASGGGGPPNFPDPDPDPNRLTPAAAMKEALGLLTPAQLRTWRGLTGPAFEMGKLEFIRAGEFGPGRMGPGGPGGFGPGGFGGGPGGRGPEEGPRRW